MKTFAACLLAMLVAMPSNAAPRRQKFVVVERSAAEAQISGFVRKTISGRLARYRAYGNTCEIVVNTDPNFSSPIYPDNPQVLWFALFNRNQWPDLCQGWMRQGMKVVISGPEVRVIGEAQVAVLGETFEWSK